MPGVFIGGKKDIRMILNLKKSNKFINYKYFEMECINNAINLMKPNVINRFKR